MVAQLLHDVAGSGVATTGASLPPFVNIIGQNRNMLVEFVASDRIERRGQQHVRRRFGM